MKKLTLLFAIYLFSSFTKKEIIINDSFYIAESLSSDWCNREYANAMHSIDQTYYEMAMFFGSSPGGMEFVKYVEDILINEAKENYKNCRKELYGGDGGC